MLAGSGDLNVIPGSEAVGIEGCVGAGNARKVKEAEAEMVVIFDKLSGTHFGNNQGFGFGFLASNGSIKVLFIPGILHLGSMFGSNGFSTPAWQIHKVGTRWSGLPDFVIQIAVHFGCLFGFDAKDFTGFVGKI